jgi:arylsulfatase A-like enzyme
MKGGVARGRLALAVGVLLAACSPRDDAALRASPSARPSPPPSLVRLLDLLGDDAGGSGVLHASAASAPRSGGPPLFEELFAVDGLAVAPGGELHRDVDVAQDQFALVTARVRAARAGEAAAGIAVKHRATGAAVKEGAGIEADGLQFESSARFAAPRSAHVDPARAEEWQELRLFCPAIPGRDAVRVTVVGGEGGASIASLEVRALAEWELPSFEPRAVDDHSTLERRRIVARGSERADSLLLAAGGSATFDVVIPETGPRFEARLATIAPPNGAPPRLRLLVDGEEIATRVVVPPRGRASAGFSAWRVPLDRFATKRVRLELAAEVAPPGGIAGEIVVGSPLLLGRRRDPPRPSLVLVSIDTLRADEVGCYGAATGATPRLDRLAAEGTRFARAHSASSWTLPSHATMLSGVGPLVHGALLPTVAVDGGRTPLLAQMLREQGYVTAAFTAGGYLDPAFGFAAGFDRYSTRDPGKGPFRDRRGEPIDPLEPALTWIAEHDDQPFFLFVHTYVVHDYSPEAAWLARRSGLSPEEAAKAVDPAAILELRERFEAGDASLWPKVAALYRAALEQADELVIGRLLDALDTRGLAERTVVSIVSDHGEQWLEHGGVRHGVELWRENTDVPWILRGPGIGRGVVVDEVVAHADVVPTLLARLGLEHADAIQGCDVLSQTGLHERPTIAMVEMPEEGRADALFLGPWKLLRRSSGPEAEPKLSLFRRDVDPEEKKDLADSEPDQVRLMVRLLERRLAADAELGRALAGPAPAAAIDSALDERLKELGYGGAR